LPPPEEVFMNRLSLFFAASLVLGLGCQGGADLPPEEEPPPPATLNGAPLEEAIFFQQSTLADLDEDGAIDETRSELLIFAGRGGAEGLCAAAAKVRADITIDQDDIAALDALTEAVVAIQVLEDRPDGGIAAGDTLTCCGNGNGLFLTFQTAAKPDGQDARQSLNVPPATAEILALDVQELAARVTDTVEGVGVGQVPLVFEVSAATFCPELTGKAAELLLARIAARANGD
jgi:hypothetical protein